MLAVQPSVSEAETPSPPSFAASDKTIHLGLSVFGDRPTLPYFIIVFLLSKTKVKVFLFCTLVRDIDIGSNRQSIVWVIEGKGFSLPKEGKWFLQTGSKSHG